MCPPDEAAARTAAGDVSPLEHPPCAATLVAKYTRRAAGSAPPPPTAPRLNGMGGADHSPPALPADGRAGAPASPPAGSAAVARRRPVRSTAPTSALTKATPPMEPPTMAPRGTPPFSEVTFADDDVSLSVGSGGGSGSGVKGPETTSLGDVASGVLPGTPPSDGDGDCGGDG